MTFDPFLAAIRFGTGLSPRHAPPGDVTALLADLSGPDAMAVRYPIPTFSQMQPSVAVLKDAAKARREARGTPQEDVMLDAYRALSQETIRLRAANLHATLARMIDAPVGLHERLMRFWVDHFTIRARTNQVTHGVTPAVEESIRPHVAGRFGTMLKAVATQPMMLLYLDQQLSHGPTSELGLRRDRGLNENLAREMLELHTVGAGGVFTQAEVRDFAELLIGLTYHPQQGFNYDARQAEPGSETVLGVTYSDAASLDTIHAALDDLALHPETARHICTKLAVHFIGPDPDADMLAQMTDAYLDNEGDIVSVVTAMLTHAAAFDPVKRKVRRPVEFIAATLRALDVAPESVLALDRRRTREKLTTPLQVMGQPWESPPGPDGWPESDAAWVTPQGMAGRISWAMEVPVTFRRDLPDPRDFVEMALGPHAAEEVAFAAAASENRIEGVGIVLASAAFQRR
jgi:uncharacterized protein (DUF1800 family)